ncbi:MAG TPA: epoxyqueuosine reductase QueH [Syntrophorhabdaceae bacterium]|nr:epoxyqueuosine reductase QueH [Syntrophorhabdaceae bacterium]
MLLHICCAPCSIYSLKALRDEGMEVTGYFYNPNIHPYSEFLKRLLTLKNYAGLSLMPLIVDKEYNLINFLKGAMEYGRDRCIFCYQIRLEKAFKKALEGKFDAVTTTLLYSRYQRHEDIKNIGSQLSNNHNIPFIYKDFRIGWKEGIEESKRLNMYRQNYCGCIFSEYERYKEGQEVK